MSQSPQWVTNNNEQDKAQATTYFNMGKQLIEQKDWHQAIFYFCKVIEIKSDSSEAFNNLGAIFKHLGELDKAEACLRKAIEYNHYCSNAYYNLGFIYKKGNHLNDAEFCFRRVLELIPDGPEVYNTLGIILEMKYQLKEAEVCYRRALKLNSAFAIASYNLGNLCKLTNRFADAEHYLRRASIICPNQAKFDMGLAFFYLSIGEFENGWKKYADALLKIPGEYPSLSIRQWQGENLTARKILLYSGKGLGDTIQFIRYVQQIEKIASKVVLLVQQPLQRLIAVNYNQPVFSAVQDIAPNDYDFACSVQTLPIIFNTVEKSIPQFPFYLQGMPENSMTWKKKLSSLDGGHSYRVGIVWSGNINNPMDCFRSIPFTTFKQLLTMDKISWISLQAGQHAKDYQNENDTLLDLSSYLVDFSQTAGVIANLDLVITMDTSVAHLAGAMGKKTWLLLDTNCDWRWQLEREDSPWYSSMQLFRQKRPGDWSEVLARVSAALYQECLTKKL